MGDLQRIAATTPVRRPITVNGREILGQVQVSGPLNRTDSPLCRHRYPKTRPRSWLGSKPRKITWTSVATV
ncbi:MAG: hypothetical protein M5T61_16965 [Acidimicrobiia bacterium]|nr:hypothetical protein [Acidimicrobiia bacterium]